MSRLHLLLGALAMLSSQPTLAARNKKKQQPKQKMIFVKDTEHPHKWIAGPPTPIDCTLASSDFEYYLERCHDELTQWWVNGRCFNGIKTEVSELHRCQRSHGSRMYCHDCTIDANGDSGTIKHVCGSDTSDMNLACSIALGSNPARDCPAADDADSDSTSSSNLALAAYSHQCTSRQTSSYLRESFHCDTKTIHDHTGDVYACGQEWYYAFGEGDKEGLIAATGDESLVGLEHPFATRRNEYCLDCGVGIQVCAADKRATCEMLGLPGRGFDEWQTSVVDRVDEEFEGDER